MYSMRVQTGGVSAIGLVHYAAGFATARKVGRHDTCVTAIYSQLNSTDRRTRWRDG